MARAARRLHAELLDTGMIAEIDAARLQLTDDPDQIVTWVDAAWHQQPRSRPGPRPVAGTRTSVTESGAA